MANCSVESCDRPHKARGFCTAHYYRVQRHGDPMADVPVREAGGRRMIDNEVQLSAISAPTDSPPKATCSVAGCEREVNSRGWCRGHYRRWLANGDVQVGVPFKRSSRECSIDDCSRETEARGLCPMHYQRWRENL